MSLISLLITFGLIAVVLTLITWFAFKEQRNWLMSFLQHFCGVWFIFSGAVKAIDPVGTAYKMQQYFGEFETTFHGTWFSFISPVFVVFSSWANAFSIAMILFEIILGLMLLIGARARFTAWAFLLLVVFFTILTGFTYLTGYVPNGVNFFEFGKWGAYEASNMKVTDCGCFGDFLKLEPKISFFKDLFLLLPSLFFVFRFRDMHRLFNRKWRALLVGVSTLGLTIFCLNNTYWNEPPIDFRPFRAGVNIREQKEAESKSEGSIQILSWTIKNQQTGEEKTLPDSVYMKNYMSYPKETWKVIDQEKTEPAIPHSKISDFEVSDVEGNDVTEDLLNDSSYSFMIVSYKLYNSSIKETPYEVMDTTYAVDTVRIKDSVSLVRRVDQIVKREAVKKDVTWDEQFAERYSRVINPFMEKAEKAGCKVYAITGYADPGLLDDFRHATQSAYPFYTADDILLKTIIRSNPGVLLLKNGTILGKWHYRHLPSFEEVKAALIK